VHQIISFLEDMLDVAWMVVKHPLFLRLGVVALVAVLIVVVINWFLADR